MSAMRTGAQYRESLRDGRRVWIMGEGRVEDVTTHPATRAMVEEYAGWYDRHFDPDWQEVLLVPPNAGGERVPWAYVLPEGVDDLIGMSPHVALADLRGLDVEIERGVAISAGVVPFAAVIRDIAGAVEHARQEHEVGRSMVAGDLRETPNAAASEQHRAAGETDGGRHRAHAVDVVEMEARFN